MTLDEYIRIISIFTTIFLGLVALFGIFYPRIHSHKIRPILEITIEPINEGKKGMNFRIYNNGKSPAHNTIATLRLIDYENGPIIGQWNTPWETYSIEFSGTVERIMDGRYGGLNIYPGQMATSKAFQILSISSYQVLGLNSLPYRPGGNWWPIVFWKLDKLPDGIEPTLQPNHPYVVYLSLYCEEFSGPTSKMIILNWDGKRLAPDIDSLELELWKQSTLEDKYRKTRHQSVIKHEKDIGMESVKLKKEN